MHKLLTFALIAVLTFSVTSIGIIYYNECRIIQEQRAISERIDSLASLIGMNAAESDRIDDRLTFLAEKINPLLVSRCHVDQIFYAPQEVPEDYPGYIFVIPDFQTKSYLGVGILCR